MQDFPANPIDKPGYILEWNDEFDGPELDTSKWLPYYLPHWSSRERSIPRYTFKDGHLVLQITEDQEPWCPEFDGDVKASCIQTGSFAGPVGSRLGQLRFSDHVVVREAQTNVQLYTPQYGYFECRAKGTDTPGNHVSLYMIGYEDKPEKCGEINMFEIFGRDVSTTATIVRYGIHPWKDPNLTDEFYQDPLDIDATKFHVYALEWTPTHVDFYVDSQMIRRINQSPEYPMQFMLSIYELTGGDRNAAYPKEFVVDYVRGYQPEAGYD
jgi:Glycosyl hydrolases family 16